MTFFFLQYNFIMIHNYDLILRLWKKPIYLLELIYRMPVGTSKPVHLTQSPTKVKGVNISKIAENDYDAVFRACDPRLRSETEVYCAW